MKTTSNAHTVRHMHKPTDTQIYRAHNTLLRTQFHTRELTMEKSVHTSNADKLTYAKITQGTLTLLVAYRI